MATLTRAPTGLDEDPQAYLALPRFNHTLDFDLKLPGAECRTASVSYALTDVPPDASWPVLVFFNGLGGHRMIAALTEAIARAHNVQMLTLDKPGAGASSLSVHIPIAARTRWMHTALLAVLAHEHIPRFAVLSHSNNLFYALYTLLHLPPTLTATSWTLTGPFVPQSEPPLSNTPGLSSAGPAAAAHAAPDGPAATTWTLDDILLDPPPPPSIGASSTFGNHHRPCQCAHDTHRAELEWAMLDPRCTSRQEMGGGSRHAPAS
ncbi:hypothetical protein C8F04DRAFT_1355027 [Mycena alexandri]|uniref:Uncharacterized protein n=1 Tax=Mycena alexandri TaxID=1745969 RepID=A0AAD6X1G9_9AGAR|nr:hypothetical protein C8F04DRAFT_1355027 [Mycena alexandri]